MSTPNNSCSVPAEVMNTNLSESIVPEKNYIFTPAGLNVKLTLAVLYTIIGIFGFLGNLSVLRFVCRKESKQPGTAMPSNLNYFIRSLAVSDVLAVSICIPIILIQYFVDVLQTRWPCKLARFFMFLFPSITVFNLVVISIERYILICRPTSRPLSRVAVKKLVKVAWILGFFIACVPLFTTKEIRIDLNDVHYTIVCQHDRSSPLKVAILQISVVLLYILPLAIISFTCASVMRAVRKKKFHAATVDNMSSAMRKWRLKQRRATVLLQAIVVAFVMPYLLIVSFNVFKLILRPPADFKRDFIMRSIGAFLAYLNSGVNFCIHLVQLRGFSKTLKNNLFLRKMQNNDRQN